MKDVNKVILLGRLGADPIRRETKTGRVVVNFSVATSRRYRAKAAEEPIEGENLMEGVEAEYTEETQWHRVAVWGNQAEACARNLKKGQGVFVEGSIRTQKYVDKEGVERLSVEVLADQLSFLAPSRSTMAMEGSFVPMEA